MIRDPSFKKCRERGLGKETSLPSHAPGGSGRIWIFVKEAVKCSQVVETDTERGGK